MRNNSQDVQWERIDTPIKINTIETNCEIKRGLIPGNSEFLKFIHVALRFGHKDRPN